MSELSDSRSPMPAHVESLMAHAPWVRALARSLVGDPHLADDLVQDTYVTALQQPPVATSNLRGWLSTVLRNLVRQSHRSESRRRSHETELHRRRTPGESDLIDKVQTEKSVVEAVLELDEPYRTALLMRYYEDLPPRKIAARLGVPVSTVHTRITRGLERLRARLDRDHGGRGAWLTALIPSLQPTANPLLPLVGAAVMNSKLYVAAVGAVALIVGTVAMWPNAEAATPDPTETAAGRSSLTSEAGTRGVGAATASEKREPVADEKRRVDSSVLGSRIPINGQLVDANAVPLVGRSVGFFEGELIAGNCEEESMTLEGGAFQLHIPAASGTLRITEAGWRTVLAPVVRKRQPQGALIVAAPAIPLAGRVIDEFGRALEGAEVRIKLPDAFRTRFAERNDAAAVTFTVHKSGSEGRFEIAEACFVEGARLSVEKMGFESVSVPVPEGGNAAVELRMHRTKRAADTISGQVVDQFGQIVEGAWVTLGLSGTKSDAQGSFTLKIPTKGPSDTLLAIKKGSLPAQLKKPSGGSADGWPAEVVLQLGGAPLSIGGRVLDDAGKPVSNAKVWIFDGRFAGRVDNTTSTIQGLVLGAASRSDIMKMIRETGKEPRELLRTTSTAMWPFVFSGADGTFRIDGLVDRDYVLRAMIDETLLMVEAAGIRAGTTDVELRLPAEAYYAKLGGRVVSKRGRPIPNAEIFTMCDAAVVTIGQGRSTQHSTAQHGRTDKDGRFMFKRVPRRLVYIRVNHENILPIEFGRHNDGGLGSLVGNDMENLIIEVDARAHVKVELGDASRADSFAMLDADDNELTINQFQGRGRSERRRQALHGGKSGVVVVAETAVKIVLYKGDEVVDESAVDLVLGEVNEIRR